MHGSLGLLLWTAILAGDRIAGSCSLLAPARKFLTTTRPSPQEIALRIRGGAVGMPSCDRKTTTTRHQVIFNKRKTLGLEPQRGDSSSEIALRAGSDDTTISSSSNNTSDGRQGILFMAMASLSFSLMFLGVKLYSNAPTFTLVFYRSVVQAILSGLLLAKEQGRSTSASNNSSSNPLGPPNVRLLLILRGTFGSLAVAAFFYAIQNLPLPDAITLQFTTPVFAALLAVPLLGEAWKPSDMMGAVFCLAGVLLIARPSWLFGVAVATAGSVTTAGAAKATTATIVGLIGAAFAALAYVLVRRIGSRADANTMVLYYAIISGLTAPLGAKLLGGAGSSWDVIGSPSPTELAVFGGLGVFGFLGQLFTNMGLTKCDSAATATLVSNVQIVFAFFFEIVVLHQSLSPWSVAGSLLIVGYMAYAGLARISNEKKAAEN